MQKKMTTQELDGLLKEARDAAQALDHLKDEMQNRNVHMYLNELLVESGKEIPAIAQQAGLSQSFTYQIFEGARNPGREVLLRLIFVFGLPLETAQRLLRLAQRGELYARLKREALLIFAIEHQYSLAQTNTLLSHFEEHPLLPSDKEGPTA